MSQHLRTHAKSDLGGEELSKQVRPQSAFSMGPKPLAKHSQARPKSAHASSLHRKGFDDPETKLHFDASQSECCTTQAEDEEKANTEKVVATVS